VDTHHNGARVADRVHCGFGDGPPFLVGQGGVLTERTVGAHPIAARCDKPPAVLGVALEIHAEPSRSARILDVGE
jgi:hypothetical protein